MKNQLSEVTVVRLILILLLVFYHSFAVYSGAWERSYTPPYIFHYDWADRLSFSFMLESFVFISGYIFGFQALRRGKHELKPLITKKIKRLIVPSILFSIAYLLCFQPNAFSKIDTVYSILEGVAHMWFLPMLFWCFVVMTIIEPYLDKNFNQIAIASIVFALLSFLPLPFRLSNSFYYFPFFLMGFSCWKIKTLYVSKVKVLVLIVAFLLCFVFITTFNQFLSVKASDSPPFIRILYIVIITVGKLFYSSIGVLLVCLMMRWIKNKNIQLNTFLLKISELCFGVYLIQQFILVYLFDYTGLTEKLGDYIVPWVFFSITLVLSLLISWFVRQSRIGKQLI